MNVMDINVEDEDVDIDNIWARNYITLHV
jgi:hypothetical protein